MAMKIMVQGTCSNAGKSVLAAALCRIFTQDGYKVCPFKAQNMALNSYITPEGLEMGRAQVMQAECCGIEPSVYMNPVLLKPTGEKGSQVIVLGEVLGNVSAADYYKNKQKLSSFVEKAFKKLDSEYDIIVIEGAGSPAEINLRQNDIVNMGMAKMAESPVLLVGDIDRGGVFASLYGTVMLLSSDDRRYIKGLVVNKFRGDKTILSPGLDMLTDMIHIPFMGVVPMFSLDLDDEDSLSSRLTDKRAAKDIDICVIALPKISNFTDFNPLERYENVSLRYITDPEQGKNADLLIIPGTKNTISDLKWLKERGFDSLILKHRSQGKPIIGICGGFQMLGQKISDPQAVESGGEEMGLGLLPHSTVFMGDKTRSLTRGILDGVDGIFKDLSGLEYSGYEIHMGVSEGGNLVNEGNVYGTYIHGFFDENAVADAVISALFEQKGLKMGEKSGLSFEEYKNIQYDRLADIVRENLDMDKIYEIMRGGI